MEQEPEAENRTEVLYTQQRTGMCVALQAAESRLRPVLLPASRDAAAEEGLALSREGDYGEISIIWWGAGA